MSQHVPLSRLLSLGVLGALALVAFALVLAPQPSLFAG